uniref:Uncharacterized protein n=1 Tax=Solanum tuberosum TaxID=4113 RepID=M1A3T5_SOLTU
MSASRSFVHIHLLCQCSFKFFPTVQLTFKNLKELIKDIKISAKKFKHGLAYYDFFLILNQNSSFVDISSVIDSAININMEI